MNAENLQSRIVLVGKIFREREGWFGIFRYHNASSCRDIHI